MALISHHTQGSYASFPSRSNLQTKEVKPKQFVSLKLVGRLDKRKFSNCRVCLRVPTILPSKVKPFKVSAFKGSAKNEESGGRLNSSKLPKNSVKLSYVPQNEETIAESSDTEQAPISYSSEREENIAGSPAIQKLFQKWLLMLRTQSTNQASNAIFEDEPVQSGISESQTESKKQEGGSKVLKAAWCYFLGLDTVVKIPLLIFVPWYLAVNVVYGAEVSKELTPLWVFGPVIVALYIKMFQGLCALYVFIFKQTVRLLKSSPTYFLLAYNYIAQGKLKEELYSRFWQPVVDVKNLNYRKLFKRKLKALEEWAVEKYLDYVESIWPYYCRTIRFLKKANLI